MVRMRRTIGECSLLQLRRYSMALVFIVQHLEQGVSEAKIRLNNVLVQV
jgi:hypothetical protein